MRRVSGGSGRGRAGAALAALALFGAGMAGCGSEPPAMPVAAPGVATSERRPFGDVISAIDTRAWVAVLDQLEAAGTDRKIRWLPRVLDAAASPEAVRAHYAALLEPEGWSPVPLAADFRKESWSYGWRSPAGGDVFAVVGLTRKRAAAGVVPFSILTTLPDAAR